MPRRAFTLIELLVVIAIIAVLAALLMPALGSARSVAKRAFCGSNMKNCALAATVYASDYNGMTMYFKANCGASWGPGYWSDTSWRFRLTDGGYSGKKAFNCPETQVGRAVVGGSVRLVTGGDPPELLYMGSETATGYADYGCGNYSINGLLGYGTPQYGTAALEGRFFNVYEPSRTEMLEECAYPVKCPTSGQLTSILLTPSQPYNQRGHRALLGMNFALCDGHVEFLKARVSNGIHLATVQAQMTQFSFATPSWTW